MMKKWLAIILALVMLLALCACGGSKTEPDDTDPETDLFEPEPEDGGGDAAQASVKGVPFATRYDSDFIIDIPDGYHYDDGWCCYINGKNVHIWAPDADLYEFDHNFEDVLQDFNVTGEGTPLGAYRYWMREEPTGQFYGPMTHYYVAFEGRYDDFYGCHIFATVEEGQDLKLTETQDIVDMLKTIRREGDPILDAPVAAAPDPTETPEPTPTEEPKPTSPFSDLFFNYSAEEAAAMSAFMNFGRYVAVDDALIGLGFNADLDSMLVRMDLEHKGAAAEIADYEILDTAAAAYLCVSGDYVYYIRDWATVCRVPIAGGTVECIVPHVCDYLQIRGDAIYYCNEDYRFCRADLDGHNEEILLDKEIYYPYLLDEDWLLYQDDADDESQHLLHLPSGEDACLFHEPVGAPVLWNTDLFAIRYGGDRNLVKIDLINPEITYDEAEGKFAYSFPVEVSANPVYSDVNFTVDGWIYTGTPDCTYVDDWQQAVNESGEGGLFYAYSGPDWEVYWDMADGAISEIWITSRGSGVGTAVPLFK